MLSYRFSAIEANAVSKDANKWLDFVDKQITEAVLRGETEANIQFCNWNESQHTNDYNEIGQLWYKANNFFTCHLECRGFKVQINGQCNLTIKW